MDCRKRSLTYSAPIFVDIKYTLGDKIMMKRGLRIGQLPIMLHSSKCVLRNKTPAELAKNRILVDMNDDGTIVVGSYRSS